MDYVDKVLKHQQSPLWQQSMSDLVDATRHLLVRDKALLDFGCGPGRLSSLLSLQTGHAIGCDADPAMIMQASKLYGTPNCRFEAYVPPFLPYATDSFDLAFATHSLGHVEDLGVTLSELVRVTRTGGHICVLNPSLFNNAARIPTNWLKGYQPDPTIRHRFTPAQLARYFSALNCRLEDLRFTGQRLFGLPVNSWRSVFVAIFVKD